MAAVIAELQPLLVDATATSAIWAWSHSSLHRVRQREELLLQVLQVHVSLRSMPVNLLDLKWHCHVLRAILLNTASRIM